MINNYAATSGPSTLPVALDDGSKSSPLYSDTVRNRKKNVPKKKSFFRIYFFFWKSDNSCDAVIIRIECLTLLPECPLLDDPKIHQLYVEFSFLGYRGAELETISVPKPAANTKAYFNYMRSEPHIFIPVETPWILLISHFTRFRSEFEFDEEEHSTQRNIMRKILTETESPTIVFILVSEPLAEEMETKDCEEVGFVFYSKKKTFEKPWNFVFQNSKIFSATPFSIFATTFWGDVPKTCRWQSWISTGPNPSEFSKYENAENINCTGILKNVQ